MSRRPQLVKDFIGAWEARNVDDIVGRMTPDARYVNVGMSDLSGREAIREMLVPFVGGASEIRWTVTHIAETAGGAVLTERLDEFVIGDKSLTVPVMGVFEFEGDLIRAWRDYFDLPGFQAQMA